MAEEIARPVETRVVSEPTRFRELNGDERDKCPTKWRRQHDNRKFIANYVTAILCTKYAKRKVAINAALPLEAALQFSSQQGQRLQSGVTRFNHF